MVQAALLALALGLFGGLWAAAGNHADPNGLTTNAGGHADPDGRNADTDAGNHFDPNG